MSVKATKKKMIYFVLGLTILILAGVIILFPKDTVAQTATRNGVQINYLAKDNEGRISFLKQYGWDISPEPFEVKEVALPADFDEVYQEYNRIQLKQNMDLTKFRTKRVKRYAYDVKNYPGVTAGVRANLLVYDDKVIGGDISTAELDGFMHGFEINTD